MYRDSDLKIVLHSLNMLTRSGFAIQRRHKTRFRSRVRVREKKRRNRDIGKYEKV